MNNKYVFLGDSLTFGYGVRPSENWVNLLKNYLKISIVNKGVNGSTTVDMLCRFKKDVLDNVPKTLFIMGGTNDLLSNRTVNSIILNIETMIKEALLYDTKIIIGIPPTIISSDANRLFMECDTYDYCEKNLPILKSELLNLCNKYSLKYIDLYSLTLNNLDKDIFLDGIHLNPSGQKLIFEEAKNYII